jgi:hypothetical protein
MDTDQSSSALGEAVGDEVRAIRSGAMVTTGRGRAAQRADGPSSVPLKRRATVSGQQKKESHTHGARLVTGVRLCDAQTPKLTSLTLP